VSGLLPAITLGAPRNRTASFASLTVPSTLVCHDGGKEMCSGPCRTGDHRPPSGLEGVQWEGGGPPLSLPLALKLPASPSFVHGPAQGGRNGWPAFHRGKRWGCLDDDEALFCRDGRGDPG